MFSSILWYFRYATIYTRVLGVPVVKEVQNIVHTALSIQTEIHWSVQDES